MPDREDELGGLWMKTANNGNEFMSGRLKLGDQEIEVVVFRNSRKQPGERTPDWRMYRSRPRDGLPVERREGPPQTIRQREQLRGTAPRLVPRNADLDDDIPF